MATVGCCWEWPLSIDDAGGPDAYRPPLGTGIDLDVALGVAVAGAVVAEEAAAVPVAGVSDAADADWWWCCCCFWWLWRWCGCCCRSCRGAAAATISGGGCSWPVAWLGVVAATADTFAGAGAATGRPTTLPAALPALELLVPTAPSPWRINSPIDPSFFFVVGIILSRIGTGAGAVTAGSEMTGGGGGASHAAIVLLVTCCCCELSLVLLLLEVVWLSMFVVVVDAVQGVNDTTG